MIKKNIYIGFDIDETLIHSVEGLKSRYDVDPSADYYIKDELTDLIEYEVYERPNINLVLNKVANEYNLFFYTRATKTYAEKIMSLIGYEDYPLFTRNDTEQVKDIGPYSSGQTYYVKRLDLIAKKLNTNVDNIIFIDDVRNINEIRPIEAVMKIKAFTVDTCNDNEFSKLYTFLNNINDSEKDLIRKIRSFNFPEKETIKNKIRRNKP